MKLKKLAVMALVAALAVVPTFSFAAGSKEYDEEETTTTTTSPTTVGEVSDTASGTSTPTTGVSVQVAANGEMVSATGVTVDKTGTSIGLVVATKTTDGVEIKADGKGGIQIGTVNVNFASGAAETAGLPETVVDKITKLNSGADLNEVIGTEVGVDLTGFKALGGTRAVVAKDAATGLTNTATEVVMQLDVKEGVQIAAVYYDNNTGRWVYAPVIIDPVTKTVKLTVPGSCTVQFVQK